MDSLNLVAYNHMGAGHYDAVVSIPQLNNALQKQNEEQYCRCSVSAWK